MSKVLKIAFCCSPAIAALAVILAPAIWSQATPQKPLKIGVVNIIEVLNKYEKLAQYNAAIQPLKTKENGVMEVLKQKIENLNKEIKQLEEQLKATPDSLDLKLKYREKAAEFSSFKAQYEYRVDSWNNVANKELNVRITECYDEITKTIENYGIANGYDLILKYDPSSLNVKEENINSVIDRRVLLYAAKETDLTETIIAEVNKPK